MGRVFLRLLFTRGGWYEKNCGGDLEVIFVAIFPAGCDVTLNKRLGLSLKLHYII